MLHSGDWDKRMVPQRQAWATLWTYEWMKGRREGRKKPLFYEYPSVIWWSSKGPKQPWKLHIYWHWESRPLVLKNYYNPEVIYNKASIPKLSNYTSPDVNGSRSSPKWWDFSHIFSILTPSSTPKIPLSRGQPTGSQWHRLYLHLYLAPTNPVRATIIPSLSLNFMFLVSALHLSVWTFTSKRYVSKEGSQ